MKHSKIRGLIGSKRFALEELSEGFFCFFWCLLNCRNILIFHNAHSFEYLQVLIFPSFFKFLLDVSYTYPLKAILLLKKKLLYRRRLYKDQLKSLLYAFELLFMYPHTL